MEKLIKWIITIVIVVMLVKAFNNYVHPETTDISYLASKSKAEIESEMGYPFSKAPDMAKKIYAYTNGEVTVDANSENGIAIVYIDGKQVGIHTDNRLYSMFGIKLGDGEMSVEDVITFEYDKSFEVLNDMYGGSSTATFFYNHGTDECLVVVINDTSNRVVALTYYKDGKTATECLRSL